MSTAATDFLDDAAASSGAAVVTVEQLVHHGQAVTCGSWPLAFRSGWAQGVIDEYSLVTIPRAPVWVRGAINVDGSILPVVDLAAYFDPAQADLHLGRQHRLLLGKKAGSPEEMSMALLFKGLPVQIVYTRSPINAWADLPERLQEVCTQMAQAEGGSLWYEVDTEKLAQAVLIHLM